MPCELCAEARFASHGRWNMGKIMRTSLAAATATLLGGIFLSTGASAQCPPLPMPTASSGCGAVITITNTGAMVTATGSPYDFGGDDIYVGVVNNTTPCATNKTNSCNLTIYSLDVSAGASGPNICGFDGDGIDYYGAPGNPMDSTGYGGPNAYFTNINASKTACRVNFITPIPPGGTSYFSSENTLSASNACTSILNNSLFGATGPGFTPPPTGMGPNSVAFGGLPTVGIRATFVPQGTDPNTNMPYTRAAAAQVCGFIDFDWQQTITNWPPPSNLMSNCSATPLTAPPPFNDQPNCGYTYTQPYMNPINTYYNFYQGGSFGLATYETPTQLSFFDAPNDPLLPAGQTLNFTTLLVGLAPPGPEYAVVPTGIGFTWTSNHKGATGGVTVSAVDPTGPIDSSGTGGTTITSVSQTATYTGVGVTAINGSPNVFATTSLLSAVLPESRSAQVNATVTAFATIINTGTATATSCSIALASGLPVTFAYQTTNPTTNAVTGSPNTPVDIPATASQSFVIALTPTAAIPPGDVGFNFSCTNTSSASIVPGLNTLLFSASTSPTPDVVALADPPK
jgi:hypothetical protein